MAIIKFWLVLYLVSYVPSSLSTFAFKRFNSPYYSYNCEIQKVISLLQCADLCSQNAGVTFFHHPIEMMCRWNCVTVNVVGSQENGWRHYGEYFSKLWNSDDFNDTTGCTCTISLLYGVIMLAYFSSLVSCRQIFHTWIWI